jgi:segregation and condensation protein A
LPASTTDAAAGADRLILRLEGFEGPLDLLLELARGQKLDLARISILSLVEQYLAIVEGARRVRLELAADWLVMAAWLTWLKSRLLLPEDDPEAEEGELAADVLAGRLQELQAVRQAAAWLQARPQLGQDVFPRGRPEDFIETDRSRLVLDLPALVRAYLGALRRAGGRASYRPRQVTLWTIGDALARLQAMLGHAPGWSSLESFLPEALACPLQRRAALASTLLAGLEMARGGALHLRQDKDFGPILVHGRHAGGETEGEA